VTGQPPPGWYPDPGERAFQRYWDGRAWTAATRGASQGPLHVGCRTDRPSADSRRPHRARTAIGTGCRASAAA
jgi:hypothetical protein